MKKIPWSSLSLLFITYAAFGWTLFKSDIPFLLWPVVVVGIVLIAIALTSPLSNTKLFIVRWFRTDAGAFTSILLLAFVAVLIIVWLHIFATGLVLFTAGALARLDLQTSGVQKWRAFWVLSAVSLCGLVVGGLVKFLLPRG